VRDLYNFPVFASFSDGASLHVKAAPAGLPLRLAQNLHISCETHLPDLRDLTMEYPMNQNPDLGSNFETPASTSPSTTRKVADAAHKAIDQSADRAEDVERRLREKAGRAQERVGASQKAAGAQLERSLDQLELFVRERPLTATGIAFAAGIVAAAILRR
jgi:ElaB/YqjD/DUF883 family membrane-anchored ribosome-binding protein